MIWILIHRSLVCLEVIVASVHWPSWVKVELIGRSVVTRRLIQIVKWWPRHRRVFFHGVVGLFRLQLPGEVATALSMSRFIYRKPGDPSPVPSLYKRVDMFDVKRVGCPPNFGGESAWVMRTKSCFGGGRGALSAVPNQQRPFGLV